MSKAVVRYYRNKHQREFHEDISSKRIHLSSGFGGGKTYALIMKMLQLSKLNRNIHGGFMCPSLTEFKKDVLPLSEQIFDEYRIPFKFHGSNYYYEFPWTRGRVYVVSAERKIRGPNWGFALINELTLCPLVRYKEVIGRVRVKEAKHPQIASVGTPEGWSNEYYDYMIENPRQGFRIIYGDTRDNIDNLSEDYITDLEDSYDSIMQDAYIRGLWVNMTGNRFYYAYKPEVNDDKKIVRRSYAPVHVSMDFNVDPATCACWNFDGRRLTGFDEISLEYDMSSSKSSTERMCDALIAREYYPEDVIIYPDPAGKHRKTTGKPDIEVLRACGFNDIRVKSAAPRFRRRQLNVNNLLSKGIIKINPDKCPGVKKDLMGVEYDPSTFEKVKTNPKLTHFSDGLDYMTDILFPSSGNKPRSRVERFR